MPRKARPFRATVTRYVDAQGNRVPRGTPGARKVSKQTETFYAKINGVKVSLKTKDEAQAWTRLRQLQRRGIEHEAGLRDQTTDQAARPILEHVEEWVRHLTNKGTASDSVRLARTRVEKVIELAGWRRLTAMETESCLAALARLQSEEYHQGRPERADAAPNRKGRSAQTRNHYLVTIKGFARWCWTTKRLREHPLISLQKIPVEADLRHSRRAPTDEEIEALFAYLATGRPNDPPRLYTLPSDGTAAVRCWMSGPHRALGYKVAMAAGLRAGELRSLTRESFDLEAGRVTVRAGYSKRRRKDVQELPAWLVEELRAWFAAGGTCWGTFPGKNAVNILKQDLAGAGIAYETQGTDGPEFFDLHALRHWFCTQMANLPSISPRTLMALCRHSSPSLTLRVYAHARRQDLRAAVDQLPVVAPLVAPSPVTTGNEHEQPSTKGQPKGQPARKARGKKQKRRRDAS